MTNSHWETCGELGVLGGGGEQIVKKNRKKNLNKANQKK